MYEMMCFYDICMGVVFINIILDVVCNVILLGLFFVRVILIWIVNESVFEFCVMIIVSFLSSENFIKRNVWYFKFGKMWYIFVSKLDMFMFGILILFFVENLFVN